MLRKHCFRSVLSAINRYNHCSQSLLSTTHRFSSNIVNTTDNSFIDTTDVSPKFRTIERREKRLNIFKSTVSETEFDILCEQLIKCTTIAKLFELIGSHNSMMNNRHITESFETLLDLLSYSSFDRRQVLSSVEFQLLCSRAMNRIRFFNTKELLTCIKAAIFLGISPQTVIFQSFLQMARQLINDFTIDQILFFDYLLRRMTTHSKRNQEYFLPVDANNDAFSDNQSQAIIPLVEALKLALPLVLQVKIESKELDLDDVNHVVSCLRMACERNVKEELINKLVAALSVKLDQLTVDQCFSIANSLICLPHKTNSGFNYVDKLIRNCLDKATAIEPNELISGQYMQILSLVAPAKGKRLFYHKELFELMANFIVEYPQKIYPFKACHVLNSLTICDHIHYGLMDHISEQIYSNQEFINDPKVSFVNILSAFALPANYHRNKPNTAEIYETIIESTSVNNCRNKGNHVLFKILKNLCILGYYPQDLIKDCVFNYLEEAVNNSTSLKLRTELLSYFVPLYQYLNINNINDSNKSMIERLKPYIDEYVLMLFHENKNNSLTNSSLNKFLSQGLGGQQFVANGVFSDCGHYIDHVVVMRKGGYPVAIGNIDKENICFIKDLSLPIDCKIIGIIGLNFRDYCRHPFVLRGETDYRIKTLKKLGIFPVIINIDSFESFQERERIPFLMREIQDVLQQSESQTDNILN